MYKSNSIQTRASKLGVASFIVVVACVGSNWGHTVSTIQIAKSEAGPTMEAPVQDPAVTSATPDTKLEAGYPQVKEFVPLTKEARVASETTNPFSKPIVTEPSTAYQQAQNHSNAWEFSVAPYLYATGIRGRIGARGRTLEVDASFGNVLSNLDLGLMGTFEARKGKLFFINDLIWTKMSAERETPGGLYSDAKLGVNLVIFHPEVGYRVAESKAGSFDVLGGVRVWSVETNLNLRSGTLPGFDVSQRKTFGAPVLGARGRINLSRKFYISSKFDIGGFGVGPDLTAQFYGGGGYRITPKIALIGGYRYLMVDYDDSEGFLFDTNMNGFVFGAKFDF